MENGRKIVVTVYLKFISLLLSISRNIFDHCLQLIQLSRETTCDVTEITANFLRLLTSTLIGWQFASFSKFVAARLPKDEELCLPTIIKSKAN